MAKRANPLLNKGKNSKNPKKPEAKPAKAKKPNPLLSGRVAAEAKRAAVESDSDEIDASELRKIRARAARNKVRWTTDNILDELRERETIRKDPAKRYTTGYDAVDGIFTSMNKSGLKCGIYLLVGDPGCGKSSWALQILSSMRKQGHLGVYCGYEGKENIHECIRRIRLPENIAVVDSTDGWDPSSDSISDKLIKLHKANDTGKPAVIVIDSVKNLNSEDGGTKGRRTAMKDLMDTVSATNSIVLLIGHVTKETRGKKVKRIQGPSELEELCDVRIDFVDVTPDHNKNQGYRHIMLDTSSKNRNGRPGEWFGYMLRENGFEFPEKLLDKPEDAIDTERDEEN